MNADVARRWIDALRSGDYEQGSGALREDGRYCCLGVLCDLAVKEKIVDHFAGADAYPSPAVVWWLRAETFSRYDRPHVDGGIIPRAAYWNDEDQATFAEIAGRLEEALEDDHERGPRE